MQNVHFTPPQLARLFDVNESTIKRWIDRGLLESTKTAGGHRRVTQKALNAFIEKNPKHAKKSYVLRRLNSSSEKLTEAWPKYYDLLLNNKEREARRYFEKMYVAGSDIIDMLECFFVPALRQIGVEWIAGNISIYEEHRMSFYIRQHIITLERYLPRPSKKRKTAILACAPQEHHELPLNLLDIVLKLNGYQTQVLGINVPLYEMLKAIDNEKPDLVCISKVYPKHSGKEFLTELSKATQKKGIDLIYGGAGWDKKLQEQNWPARSRTRFTPSLRELNSYLKEKK